MRKNKSGPKTTTVPPRKKTPPQLNQQCPSKCSTHFIRLHVQIWGNSRARVDASHPENDGREPDDSRRGQARLSGEYEREVPPECVLLGKPYERRKRDDDREHFRRLSFADTTRRTR